MSALFSCREATRLVSEALDRRLRPAERAALGVHLAMCRPCRAYRRQIALIDRLFAGYAVAKQPSLPLGEFFTAAARERLKVRLRS